MIVVLALSRLEDVGELLFYPDLVLCLVVLQLLQLLLNRCLRHILLLRIPLKLIH